MKYWQRDLLGATEGVQREQATFNKIETGARALRFSNVISPFIGRDDGHNCLFQRPDTRVVGQ